MMIKKSFCAILMAVMLAALPPKPANSFVFFTIDLTSLKEQIDGIINAVKEAIMNCKAVKAIADTMAAIGSAMDTIEKFKQDVMDQLAELNKIKELAEEYYGEYKEYKAYVEQQIQEAKDTIREIEEAKETIMQMKEEYIDPLMAEEGGEDAANSVENAAAAAADKASASEEHSSADKMYTDKEVSVSGEKAVSTGGAVPAISKGDVDSQKALDSDKEKNEEEKVKDQIKELQKMSGSTADALKDGASGKFRMSKQADLKGMVDAVKSKADAGGAAAVKDGSAVKAKMPELKDKLKAKTTESGAKQDALPAREKAPAIKKGFREKNSMNMSENGAPDFFFEVKYSHKFADGVAAFQKIPTGKTEKGNVFIPRTFAETCELSVDKLENSKYNAIDDCVSDLQLKNKTNDEKKLDVSQKELDKMKRESAEITLWDYMKTLNDTNTTVKKSVEDITNKIGGVSANRDIDMLIVDMTVEMSKVMNTYAKLRASSLIDDVFQKIDDIEMPEEGE